MIHWERSKDWGLTESSMRSVCMVTTSFPPSRWKLVTSCRKEKIFRVQIIEH